MSHRRLAMQGDMSALFLRHEGYLGALGCFLKAHPIETPAISDQGNGLKVRCLDPYVSSAAGGLSCLSHPCVMVCCLPTAHPHAWPRLATKLNLAAEVTLISWICARDWWCCLRARRPLPHIQAHGKLTH